MASQPPGPDGPVPTPVDDPVPSPIDPVPLEPSDPVANPAPAGNPLYEGP
ncbi:hypothetical protein Q4F19_20805 [Sphingomonas sp. BIUV-7]|uniref:Stereocilin n=1 Tax=Sphingomonas natans TaxID=3063330 RepID=A0ABT8YEN3_9SPHN|nr:hypothetical protein [Sphingomonas sp. BIUV-7]MDO6416836.1 hypothetical protein [Sphingomonas sp. BIUV-7]